MKTAMVVDNDFFFVEFLCELLEKRGYRVIKAYNGKEGIAKLDQERPVDILFADLVMPKVAGKEFFHYIRKKFNGRSFPLVALSGTMLEHMGNLEEIGADFYIAKGPIAKLTVQLNAFMVEIETQPFFPSSTTKILETGGVFPRRDAVELINSLQFHQAIINSAGIGLVIVDRDTKIINANTEALEITGCSSVEALNAPVVDIFPRKERSKLSIALKQAVNHRDSRKISFYTVINSRIVRAIVSLIRLESDIAGWVVALDEGYQSELLIHQPIPNTIEAELSLG